jgi:lipopolysaccharide/colanic/teichoic acid biosynthesis glycosyltransferase
MATNLSSSSLSTSALHTVKAKPKRLTVRPSLNPMHMLHSILSEELFLGILCLDRKRAERSGKRIVLMLMDAEEAVGTPRIREIQEGLVNAANSARRETDPAGWYKKDCVLGIIFTELGETEAREAVNKLVDKVREALVVNLKPADMKFVHLTLHVFADDSDDQTRNSAETPMFYPDLLHREDSKRVAHGAKRAMDITGSLAALFVFSPLFLLIAALVKLSSKGPVFFRQERLGQFGSKFTCLKFRTMYVNNDLKIHQEFIKRVINGTHDGKAEGSDAPVYKMTNDPRITKIGAFIRRTSLDELPQFLNVLMGDMSLVGPRPPLAYEYEEYDLWHRRRVLEAKPGITGLWQVKGRSRVRFDDMVRLDLQYVRGWSLWLDIRILFATPRAVVFGDDAY